MVPSHHILFLSRHIHILHYFGHFGQCMEIFAFIFNNTYNILFGHFGQCMESFAVIFNNTYNTRIESKKL